LFGEGRAGVTGLVWAGQFMDQIVILFMNSWLPLLISGAGISIAMLANDGVTDGGSRAALLVRKTDQPHLRSRVHHPVPGEQTFELRLVFL
jgi:hypothetical protein